MSDLFDVSGKTALVTGGSRGIGFMIARGLVGAGARVIVSSRKSADVEAAAKELSALGDCHAIPADISTQEGAQALAAATRQRFPSLDILVNNAGAAWGAPLEEFPAVGWQKVLSTNVEGIFHLTVALLGELRAAASVEDPARVINIGSINGLQPPDRRELQLQREQGRGAHAHAPPRQAPRVRVHHRQCDRAGTLPDQNDGLRAR